MDLVYADETRKDKNVLHSYKLDMAFGKDENDFAVNVDLHDHCCRKGYYIYAEDTEYGGIVDDIKADTEKSELTYKGRTWHGVLAHHVICPPPGEDYRVVSGEANTVIQQIIDLVGLSDLFVASTDDTGVLIRNYQFPRYCYAYPGILKMLKTYGLKLELRWVNRMIVAAALPVRDYSQDDEFDADKVPFSVEVKGRPVNHIICLGRGDLKNRNVIHLFVDEHGGIQPYTVNGVSPVEDSDYILDTSMQVLFGQDEVEEVYDNSSAEITTNYVPLASKPADWALHCDNYYKFGSNGEYTAVDKPQIGYTLQKKKPYDWTENYDDYYTYNSASNSYSPVAGTPAYTLLSSKPGNWNTGYGQYYVLSSGVYSPVTPASTTNYVRQTSQPDDWIHNYQEYFNEDQSRVEGISYDAYILQTKQPSDWDTAYGTYYRRATARELEENSGTKWYAVTLDPKGQVPRWKARMYYSKTSRQMAPMWGEEPRYTKVQTAEAPQWSSGTYYQRVGQSAPTWQSGTYYSASALTAAPAWKAGMYFRAAIDHYASMIEKAIEKFEEYYGSDDLKISLEETDRVYDVGDIVGARESVTGITTIQEVVKKIITITNDDIEIKYEVG